MSIRIGKQITAFLLAFFLLCAGSLAANAEKPKARSIVYTALGDSIASGYRLSRNSDAYVSLFGKYLSADTSNLAQAGLDSAGLLKKLTSDKTVINQVKKSDVVTISMGGNDMLPIFESLQPNSPSALVGAIQKINSKGLQQEFQAAVDKFRQNWAEIIAQVRNLAPNAQIIVTTLIDPYQDIVINIPLVKKFDLGAYADQYIKQINTVITGSADSGQYAVADAYTLFKQHKSQKLTNADLPKLDFDPHPNVTGHRLLFEAHQAVSLTFADNLLAVDGPSRITIRAGSTAAAARFSAVPLLTCFTADGASPNTAFSLEDTGSTGASIDAASGTLHILKPGTIQVKATVTAQNGKLTVETVKAVRVVKETAVKTQSPFSNRTVLLCAAALAIILAIFLAIVLIRKNTAKRS